MTKLEQAARALLAHWDTPAWKYLKPTGDLMADLREALEQSNCQCGDKCFPIFSGDIEYCETCGKPIALEQAKQEPIVSNGVCGGCAKKAADGWALYCVECWQKAEQEPVAWMNTNGAVNKLREAGWAMNASPARTKDMTDAELHQIWRDIKSLVGLYSFQEIACAVIAAYREKNRG